MGWTITRAAATAIRTAVDSSPKTEIGGMLGGDADARRITSALSLPNWARFPCREFRPAVADLVERARWMESIGVEPIGGFHSHPSGETALSAMDYATAELTGLLLIACPTDAGGQCRLFWPGRSGVEAVELRVFGD
jgi:proteasome lid subunit RPN8/RPN11